MRSLLVRRPPLPPATFDTREAWSYLQSIAHGSASHCAETTRPMIRAPRWLIPASPATASASTIVILADARDDFHNARAASAETGARLVEIVRTGSEVGVGEGRLLARASESEVRLQVVADQAGSKHTGNSRNRGKGGQPVSPIPIPDRRGHGDAHLWRGARLCGLRAPTPASPWPRYSALARPR